jgi:hypothetical protein
MIRCERASSYIAECAAYWRQYQALKSSRSCQHQQAWIWGAALISVAQIKPEKHA